ncbi:flagellar hook-associated protein 3 FlgL [Pullulanibacillus pueri]|uniref:Flagellar hook-associated protein 3 n=1 Tax=Pullulanibacillus pueri TaxID=1437324 RepID=A0A8J3EKA7_9BACL|nr:flagellar hook-associated protein FlgL [Pullulanibacillus pueri]MBM7684125.1 flagellar hook-associated protein 3 FlgL [Pullulanibacillus pueri]GGH76708.1 flagellar hook-associated protein 3 [Pullulanibacillus pueri]
MRITQSMLSQDFLRQLNNSTNNLATLQQQLTTGKKITKPSQDPVIATLGIGYRSDVNHVDQYSRNMDTVHQWMDSSDSALDETNDVLQRLNELTTEASNDTYTADQRANIEKEVGQLKNQLVTIANTQVAGKYIFNGTNTSTKPVNDDGTLNYDPDKMSDVNITVNNGIQIKANVNPNDVFSQKLFDDIDQLQDALKDSNSKGADISKYISVIQGHMDNVTSAQADLGARENRVDLIDNRLSNQKEITENIMSKNEDADFETTLIDFQTQQTIHNAALAVGSKIMQPTLVDFLS